jgi:hypothetical protein
MCCAQSFASRTSYLMQVPIKIPQILDSHHKHAPQKSRLDKISIKAMQ